MKVTDFLLTVTYHVIFFFEKIFRRKRSPRSNGLDISRMASLKGFRKEY